MAIEPGLKRLLDQVALAPRVDYQGTDPFLVARQLRAAAIPSPPPPNPVASVRDLEVAGPHGPVPIRIYLPRGQAPFPVCMSYHGGGWVLGSIARDDARNQELVHRSGCAVVAVDYRLAPEHRFPVPLDDCYAALQWVAHNAGQLGLDATRIGVAGTSAGANLATAVAMRSRDTGGPALRFQLLIIPVCDDDFERPSYLEFAQGYYLTREQMRWFWDQYADAEQRSSALVSPLKGKLANLPPALVITAELDPLRDEGEAYAQRLAEAGVPVELIRYDGVVHGFMGIDMHLPQSQQALASSAAAMVRHLRSA